MIEKDTTCGKYFSKVQEQKRRMLILDQWEQTDARIEILRAELHEITIKLGTSHSEVLRLSQELDKLINVIQKRWRYSQKE